VRSSVQTLILILIPCLPTALAGQDSIPSRLAQVETERSRACVAPLADLVELNSGLEGYSQQVNRLNQLGRAISLEKRQDAEPLDLSKPEEAEVAEWFTADSALAARFLAESDSTILAQRDSARHEIQETLRQRIRDISATAQGELTEGAPIQAAAEPCVGAILIRGVVLDECGNEVNPVCEAARAEEPEGVFSFVDEPEDLWGVEGYGPWSTPGPVQIGPTGEMLGANTSARARIANVVFRLTLRPVLNRRSALTEDEIGEYRAALDSLGFTFDHPDFVMIPGLDLQGSLPPPIGGETHYVLHFGDLSGDDVIWSMEAGEGGPLNTVIPATARDLERLRAGELVSLSAIRAPSEEGETGEAVFSLSLLQIGQAASVDTLVRYLSDGSFDQDLQALLPPGGGG
jgi:hypothetical protein